MILQVQYYCISLRTRYRECFLIGAERRTDNNPNGLVRSFVHNVRHATERRVDLALHASMMHVLASNLIIILLSHHISILEDISATKILLYFSGCLRRLLLVE